MRERIPARFGLDPLRDVQVLTPMNRSELGAQALNLRLQEALNPATTGPQVQRFGWTFRVGDKVMQTHNNYQKEVFNGDIGRISAIDETSARSRSSTTAARRVRFRRAGRARAVYSPSPSIKRKDRSIPPS